MDEHKVKKALQNNSPQNHSRLKDQHYCIKAHTILTTTTFEEHGNKTRIMIEQKLKNMVI
jgi:hypothetical protein